MHTELVHVVGRLHHHVEQMRHGRTLVTANIGNARLQQRFGNGQYPFTVKSLSLTQTKKLDFTLE